MGNEIVVNIVKSPIAISIATTLITAILAFVTAIFWYEDTKMSGYTNTITMNKDSINALNERITGIYKKSENLEIDIENFVTKEYGSLSKRDESVAKLEIRVESLEARIENIELLLSKL